MARDLFVNLPVADVARSTAFYEAIGFEKNPKFSNEQASAMTWSETIAVMLLDRAFYATFTDKRILDAKTHSGALLAFSRDSRAEVDAITEAAVAAGGQEVQEPEELGFLYSRGFDDPDGHGWGPFFIDETAAAAEFAPAEEA